MSNIKYSKAKIIVNLYCKILTENLYILAFSNFYVQNRNYFNMIDNKNMGSTYSSSDYDALLIKDGQDNSSVFYGQAFILKKDDFPSEDHKGDEIIEDKEVIEILKNSPGILKFFKTKKVLIPFKLESSDNISEASLDNLKQSLSEIKDPQIKLEALTVLEIIRKKGGSLLYRLFIALGILVVTFAKPKSIIEVGNPDFTTSMPIPFNNIENVSYKVMGATQSMDFYFTGSL